MFENAHIIDSYSRNQAIEDGFLCEVNSKIAGEAGFRWPLALTNALYQALALEDDSAPGQSYDGRLWDVLSMARFAIQRRKGADDTLRFKVGMIHHVTAYRAIRHHAKGYGGCQRPSVVDRHHRQHYMVLRLVCGPDDTGAPCITIGFDQGDEW